MRVLQAVPGVLWLYQGTPEGADKLRGHAAAAGVDPQRLVFAPHLPADQHLSRLRQADLFLDTLPCNAHTTASDALWAGVPLLTCLGNAFQGRVAASLLRALSLDELVTTHMDDYEAMAIELGQSPLRLAALRDKLAAQRLISSLLMASASPEIWNPRSSQWPTGTTPVAARRIRRAGRRHSEPWARRCSELTMARPAGAEAHDAFIGHGCAAGAFVGQIDRYRRCIQR